MGRNGNESVEQWYRRSVVALREAKGDLSREWERLGLDRVIAHGKPYPHVDRVYEEALMRVRSIEDDMLAAARAAGGSSWGNSVS